MSRPLPFGPASSITQTSDAHQPRRLRGHSGTLAQRRVLSPVLSDRFGACSSYFSDRARLVKTFALAGLHGRVPDLAIHDFDEIGVPAGADTAWRHRAIEQWVQRALTYQAEGTDLLLAGQTPFGELLAAPSAFRLDAISACLLDCDDATRVARLRARGPEWLEQTGGNVRDYLNWAVWMREHAADPSSRTKVIRQEATLNEMRWTRWSDWHAGDPRWRVRTVDTSALPVENVADELVEWINAERALFRSGAHPLAGTTAYDQTAE